MAIQHLLVCVAILKCHEDSKKPSERFAYLFVSAVWASYSPKDNRGNGLASFVYCVSETFTVLFFREVFVDYRFVWYFVTDASSTFEFGLSPSFADFRAVSACRRAAIFEHTAWRPCVTPAYCLTPLRHPTPWQSWYQSAELKSCCWHARRMKEGDCGKGTERKLVLEGLLDKHMESSSFKLLRDGQPSDVGFTDRQLHFVEWKYISIFLERVKGRNVYRTSKWVRNNPFKNQMLKAVFRSLLFLGIRNS